LCWWSSYCSFEELEYREKLGDFLLGGEAEWNLSNILDESARGQIFQPHLQSNRGKAFIPREAEKRACQQEMMKVRRNESKIITRTE